MKHRNTQRNKSLERLWLWFFPRRCVWCSGVTAPQDMLCPGCTDQAQLRCAPSTLPESDTPLVSVFPYHSGASRIMLNVKFHGARSSAPSIGYAMADAFAAAGQDKPGLLFCSVPMTNASMRKRGYNQSELLAAAAARWLGAEHQPDLLIKTRETQVQHDLPKAERLTNMTNAFAAAQPETVRGRGIVLVDDICTTGATLCDAVRALRQAGAEEIICLTYLH